MTSLPPRHLPIGYLLHDTYQIESILGRGGFGITYLARDTALDRLVAVKEFFPKNFCERGDTTQVTFSSENGPIVAELQAKFLKEARNIARLDNPGIIKIYSAFDDKDTAYYVMEYIDGQSLADIVHAYGKIAIERSVGYISAVGEALEYLHGRSMNHLDVKPANIMMRRGTHTPVLIDFGLSKQYDTGSNLQTSLTPIGVSEGFTPIEGYTNGGISSFSPQSDLYSLAATLYFITTATTPPAAHMLLEAPLTFPDDYPEGLRKAVTKAMSPSRKDRHASVREFIAEIKPFGDGNEPTADDREPTTIPKAQLSRTIVLPVPPPLPGTPAAPAGQPETVVVAQSKEPPATVKPAVMTDSMSSKPTEVVVDAFATVNPDIVRMGIPTPTHQPSVPSEKPPVESRKVADFDPTSTRMDYAIPVQVEERPKGRSLLWLWITLGVVVLLGAAAAVYIFVFDGLSGRNYVNGYTVTDLEWESPWGKGIYTGETSGYIESDGDMTELVPDGKGSICITEGEHAGSIYDGDIVDGHFSGNAKYTLPNGDIFVGRFTDDKYNYGRYTISSTGDYFEGTFVDGAPDEGRWYDKYGKVIEN